MASAVHHTPSLSSPSLSSSSSLPSARPGSGNLNVNSSATSAANARFVPIRPAFRPLLPKPNVGPTGGASGRVGMNIGNQGSNSSNHGSAFSRSAPPTSSSSSCSLNIPRVKTDSCCIAKKKGKKCSKLHCNTNGSGSSTNTSLSSASHRLTEPNLNNHNANNGNGRKGTMMLPKTISPASLTKRSNSMGNANAGYSMGNNSTTNSNNGRNCANISSHNSGRTTGSMTLSSGTIEKTLKCVTDMSSANTNYSSSSTSPSSLSSPNLGSDSSNSSPSPVSLTSSPSLVASNCTSPLTLSSQAQSELFKLKEKSGNNGNGTLEDGTGVMKKQFMAMAISPSDLWSWENTCSELSSHIDLECKLNCDFSSEEGSPLLNAGELLADFELDNAVHTLQSLDSYLTPEPEDEVHFDPLELFGPTLA